MEGAPRLLDTWSWGVAAQRWGEAPCPSWSLALCTSSIWLFPGYILS